jgi:hypothetical protein
VKQNSPEAWTMIGDAETPHGALIAGDLASAQRALCRMLPARKLAGPSMKPRAPAVSRL